MNRRSIVVSVVGVVLIINALLLPRSWTAATATEPSSGQPSASRETPKKGTDLSAQSFEDAQSIGQRFAEELGRLKEQDRTVSPVKLAEQASAEPVYAFSPAAESPQKLDAETVYARAKPGVVVVGGIFKCDKCRHWHVKCASGFVIRHDGLIVTNMHAIDAFKKLEAAGVMTADGRVFPVKAVLAASRRDDLALLKVEAEHLEPLAVSKDVSVGATVYCLSHPMLPNGSANCFFTFSQGTVCGKFAMRDKKQQAFRVLAVTNDYGPGSSGGPILNDRGAVVGVACQAISLGQQEPEKERNVQMIWRFGRPSCSILDMLSSSKRPPIADKAQPAAVHAEAEISQVEGPKPTPPVAGGVTSELRPADRAAMGYYRPIRIALSDTPAKKPKTEPKYQSARPLYGVLKLGDADDNQILVVLDEPDGGDPKLYIDRKGDGDLANAGSGQWDRTTGATLSLNNVAIDVPYRTGKIPYTFNFYRFKTRNRDFLFCYRNSGREGDVTLDGKRYRVLVLDDNADARFDDLPNGALVIDINQDGTLEKMSDSAEYFRLNEPFNINGKVWEVASVTPDGLRITVRPSKADVPIKAYLTPGNPAPVFTGKGLDGSAIDLKTEAGKGKYVLVDFWASWCGPCRADFPTIRRIQARYKDHGLTIVGVNLDSKLSLADDAAKGAKLAYPHVYDGLGWKNAVAQLYRVHSIPQMYLLDGEMKIVAKNLRGPGLERRLQELLGPGDEKAAAAVDKAEAEAREKAKAKAAEKAKPKTAEKAN